MKGQIDALREQAGVVEEDYLSALIAYNAATGQVTRARAKIVKLRKQQTVLQTSLDARVENMYRNGRLSMLDVLLGASSFEEFSTAWDILNRMNRDEATSVAKLKQIRTEAAATQVTLTKSQASAKRQFDVMAKKKREGAAKVAEANALLKGIESEIAQLEATQRAQEAAAAARARRVYASSSSGSNDNSFKAPTHNARGGVVSIAMQYLGAPYVWAADGPNSFDCSGFTMFVYRQVGVSLPHSSRAQINCGERVSRGDLQPGDLVFFGTSRIHHVGIYIGGGQFIHAPSSGDVVKISSLDRGGYAGACRP